VTFLDGTHFSLGTRHDRLEPYWLHGQAPDELLFTENETNMERVFGAPNASPFVKDAFHAYVIAGQGEAGVPLGSGQV